MQKMTYKDQQCYLAADIARNLGYRRVKDFIYRAKRWLVDAGRGEQMLVVQGDDLKNLKDVKSGQLEMHLGKRAKTATIVFVRGVQIICERSRKPEADGIRANVFETWLREDQVPPTPVAVAQQGLVPVAQRVAQPLYPPLASSVTDQLVKIGVELADLGPAGEILATDILRQTAERLLSSKLQTQDVYGPWKMPSVIASDNNVTPDAVGRAVTKLNLRGSLPGMCFPYIGMDTNDRSREMYLYSKKATDLIIEVLNEYKKNLTRVAVPHPVATPPPKVGKVVARPYARN